MEFPLSMVQEHYIPVIPDGQSYLTQGHSWRKMALYKQSEPDRTCGFALRVGYTGNQRDAFAIYRLHVLFRSRMATMPDLFVFQEGFFVCYGEKQKQDDDPLEDVLQRTQEAVQE